MVNVYHLFTSYSTYVENFKVIITDRSLSSVIGKWRIQISNFITHKFVHHAQNVSYNLIFISHLTKNSLFGKIPFILSCFSGSIIRKTIDRQESVKVYTTLMRLM